MILSQMKSYYPTFVQTTNVDEMSLVCNEIFLLNRNVSVYGIFLPLLFKKKYE